MAAPKTRPVDPVKTIRQRIERERKKATRKGLNFTAPTDEQLRRKLGRVNSPIIISQGWTSAAPAGGSISYTVGISNPDAFSWNYLYAHVFVGPANPVQKLGRALQCVDASFARLTQPAFSGLTVGAGDTESVSFELPVPAGTEPSEYLGNTFLFQADYHDVGQHFDRGVFPFTVT